MLSELLEEKSQTGKDVHPMLFVPKDKGQGLVEYALILVLVAVVVIAVYLLLKDSIGPIIQDLIFKNTPTAVP